ncbi:fasciclin domain-containing protein [Streptosporangium roseum]|uniref:Beta-Ig-H3/fasciclin n=1 Tax=Streptosporangium roseum (strain ATCC 12428 / DSM 43021 / JCM 3005 / KCTC 9067 / NCIMB 10171 / NRRL 2505 / NI 9100) TaxID=479432 RepID=D2B643_STRRD|nr:fasciclin domain-containing protein [Streptosporangium roseum]ACZ83756.1 beta-Ig-H3/fasciclin [Streptosporangium roseum DSM 43021]
MKSTAFAATAIALLALTAACGNDTAAGGGAADEAASAPAPSASATATRAATGPAMAGAPFGAACSAVPVSGEGSFTGMADDPVATAASNNPVLSTLVAAVKKAGLVDTLNSAKDITVFAPTDDAFAKIPKETLDKVLADKATLTKILTYHVVSGRKAPADLSDASPVTLQGGKLTVKGSGEDYTVNDAKVVCGNVPTGNATVYIVDTVLMPK